MKLESLGLGMRVWGPEWGALGRNNHTRFIRRLFKERFSSEFGAGSVALELFLEVEGSLTSEPRKVLFKNGYFKNSEYASCTVTIRESESLLPDNEFKLMFSKRLIDASRYFAPYMEKKLPGFKSEAYMEFIEQVMKKYLDADISDEVKDHELRSLELANEHRNRNT